MKHLRVITLLWALLVPGFSRAGAEEGAPAAAAAESDSSEQILFREADDALRRGDLEWALEQLQGFVRAYPDSPLATRAHLQRGMILEQQGRTEQAVAAYEASIEKAPRPDLSVNARLRVGAIYSLSERHDEAVRVLDPLMDEPLPEDSRTELYRLLIRAHEGLGLSDRARRERLYFWKILRPGDERTALELFLMDYTRDIEDESSVEGELRVTGLPPFYEAALLERLLELKVQMKNLQGSLDVIDRFLERFPGDARARLMEIRRRDLQQASQIDPSAIGVLLPLSARGALGAFAANARKAIEIAVKHTSRRGGTDTVRIIVKDTQGQAIQAVTAFNELVANEKVVAVIGPIGVSEVKAVAARAAETGVPMLSLSPSDGLAGQGSFVFRMLPTVTEQVTELVRYARLRMGLKNFAILYPDTLLGQNLFGHYVSEVERLGGRVVGAERYDGNTTDFKIPLFRLAGLHWPDARKYEIQRNRSLHGWQPYNPRRIEEIERYWAEASGRGSEFRPRNRADLPPVIDFDALFIAGLAPKVGLILPQITFRDVRGAQLLGFSEWNDPELFARAGGQAQGALIVDGFSPALEDPRARELAKEFAPPSDSGEPVKGPAMFEARAYDALSMVAEAAQKLGIPSRTGLALRLSSSSGYAGIGGRIRFSRDGRTELPLVFLEASGKEFVPVAR